MAEVVHYHQFELLTRCNISHQRIYLGYNCSDIVVLFSMFAPLHLQSSRCRLSFNVNTSVTHPLKALEEIFGCVGPQGLVVANLLSQAFGYYIYSNMRPPNFHNNYSIDESPSLDCFFRFDMCIASHLGFFWIKFWRMEQKLPLVGMLLSIMCTIQAMDSYEDEWN